MMVMGGLVIAAVLVISLFHFDEVIMEKKKKARVPLCGNGYNDINHSDDCYDPEEWVDLHVWEEAITGRPRVRRSVVNEQ